MKVGDRFRNLSGDLVVIDFVGPGGIVVLNGTDAQLFSHDEAFALILSGAWRPDTMAPPDAPGRCSGCGTVNEYQRGVYLCWACRNGY